MPRTSLSQGSTIINAAGSRFCSRATGCAGSLPAGCASGTRTSRRSLNGEGVGASAALQLAPGDRRRDRKATQRQRGVGADGGQAAAVAQPVEEQAALPLGLCRAGDVALRRGRGEALGEAPAVGVRLFPVEVRL